MAGQNEGRESQRDGINAEKRMGNHQGYSEGLEDAGSERIIFGDSARKDQTGSDDLDTDDRTRQEIIGGILRQLKRLQAAHLAYVKAHKERLETRLRENENHQQQIAVEMENLEKVILSLLESESE